MARVFFSSDPFLRPAPMRLLRLNPVEPRPNIRGRRVAAKAWRHWEWDSPFGGRGRFPNSPVAATVPLPSDASIKDSHTRDRMHSSIWTGTNSTLRTESARRWQRQSSSQSSWHANGSAAGTRLAQPGYFYEASNGPVISAASRLEKMRTLLPQQDCCAAYWSWWGWRSNRSQGRSEGIGIRAHAISGLPASDHNSWRGIISNLHRDLPTLRAVPYSAAVLMGTGSGHWPYFAHAFDWAASFISAAGGALSPYLLF